ncbi:MAG: hypothetical protein Q7R92_01385 [bacterium]|nr:hypothetical protein [bacterium]
MKLFMIGWDTNEEFIDVALKLQDQGHEILYWVGVGNDRKYNFEKFKNKVIFHRFYDAASGIPPTELANTNFTPPGEDLIRQFHETESILSTMKFFEKFLKSTLEKKRLFHYFLEYWLGVLEKFKPDAIIFSLCPHAGFDFVIYSLAKYLKIKTIMFEYVRAANRLLLINDYKIGSLKLREEISNNKKYKLEDLSLDIQEYYKFYARGGGDKVTTPDFKIQKKKYLGVNLLIIKIKMIINSILDFSIIKKSFLFILKRFKSNLKKEYCKLQVNPDFNNKYIYIALHFQPELATSPLGGIFIDQISMIKILSASLPKDWFIYVKEHPAQWLPSGLSFSSFRYEGFYKEIAKLKNVNLVPINTDSIELINNSRLVATVTGSVGWEAAMRLKPVLAFGYPWYRDCPGVFKVNNVDLCKQVIDSVNSGLKLNEQDIINYLASIDKISFFGYFMQWIKEQSKITGAEHSNNFFKAIVCDLNNK